MEQPGSIRDLFEKHMRGTASVAEQEQLSEVLERCSNEELTDVLESIAASTGRDPRFSSVDWETVLQSILQHPREASDAGERTGSGEWQGLEEVPQETARIIRLSPQRRFVAAAIVLLVVLGAGLYGWLGLRSSKESGGIPVARFKNDILPGGDKAVLTLADGTTILLDSAQSGRLTQQGNAVIVKLNNGQLAYKTQHEKPAEVLYNSLTTPRGGQYQLTLPDGSKVWLNAASSIHYPTAFSGKERRVEIRGEAYFEVAKDPHQPFKVVALAAAGKSALEIAVLGTRFNVNTYEDEVVIKTSLLEGRVSVNGSRPLQEGEEAVILRDPSPARPDMRIVKVPDIEESIAWKEGIFHFDQENIAAIMRQLSRWYDVEIAYEGPLPKDLFTAIISRNNNISQVLKMLEATNRIHFKIENKKITIMR